MARERNQEKVSYYLDFIDKEIIDGYLHFTIETPDHNELIGKYRINGNELETVKNSSRYPEIKKHWKEIRNECQKKVNNHDEYVMKYNFRNNAKLGDEDHPFFPKQLRIGNVPNLLVVCGASNHYSFDISQSIITECIKQGITEEQLFDSLNNVKNPVMVLQGEKENSFIVVTEYCDNQGDPILISVEERKANGSMGGMEVKKVHAQREFAACINDQTTDGKVIAVDHNKAKTLYQNIGEMYSPFKQVISFDESIAYDMDGIITETVDITVPDSGKTMAVDAVKNATKNKNISDKGLPTEKQMSYAAGIAKALDIPLPEENTKAAYQTFISDNQERFNAVRTQALHYTDEQIARANAVDILDYAHSQGLELKREGNDWRVKNYAGGFLISPETNNWNWFVENQGGGVVQLCMFLENKTWQEAIGTLLNEDMEPIRRTADWKPEPKPPKEFNLPEQNDTNKHVYAYLTKTRGIDADIVKAMLDQGYIYENKYRSCVFVGRDSDGVPRHASVRSTNTTGNVYKKDVSGSQKKFSFSVSGTSGILNVFEAPIDALSYMSMQKQSNLPTNDSYLSLGGVSDKALERYLKDHSDIRSINICTDHDEAGEQAAAYIVKKYDKEYAVDRTRPVHKDFNEDLLAGDLSSLSQPVNKQEEKSFAEQVDEANDAPIRETLKPEDVMKINQNYEENKRFSESISQYIDDTIDRTKPIVVGKTPNALVIAGAGKDIDITINIGTLQKCMSAPDEYFHGHAINEETMRKIPDELRNPVMVFKGNKSGSLVAISELLDAENRGIMIAIQLNQRLGFNEVNRISSIYGRNNFRNYIENQLQSGNILAMNKKKADKMLHSLGLQLPQENTFISYDDSIAYTLENVKFPENDAKQNFTTRTGLSFDWKKGSQNDNAVRILKENNIAYRYNLGNLEADFDGAGIYLRLEFQHLQDDIFEILVRKEPTQDGATLTLESDIEKTFDDFERLVMQEPVQNEAALTLERGAVEQYKEFTDNHRKWIQAAEVSRIPVVINAFGGPGSGKSVSCMDICQQLKKLGYNAEYVQEYAKDLVYDENWDMLDGMPEHQFEILKEQLRRVDRLYGSVDFIVTDSPVLLNGVYNKELTPEYDNMVTALYKDFENFTYFVERDASAFQQEGRIHNLEESQKIDQDIKELLSSKEIYYGTYNHETIHKVVSNAVKTFNRVNHLEEEPTQKQIAYAGRIAKALNIDLPEENTKSAYKDFIHENQEQFSQNKEPLMAEDTRIYTYEDYLQMVSQNGSTLKEVPREHYTDELLLAAVSNWGAAIRNISEKQITPEIALASVKQYGTNLKHIPAHLKSEAVCVAAYVSSSGKSISYTPRDMKDRVKQLGLEQLSQKNGTFPSQRQLDAERLQEQGQEWLTQIENVLKIHETDPAAMVEDIAFAARFYPYSVKNMQLMRMQNPYLTYVASASSYEKMGYHVKADEPALVGRVPVFAKYIINENNERVYAWDYTPEIKEQLNKGTLKEQQAVRKFQFVAAFYDISQTDCPVEDYPSVFHMGVPSEMHQEAFDAMKEFAEKSLGFKVMITDMKSISLRGSCEPDKKIIRINEKLEATSSLSTLCHEIAHGIIHTSDNSKKMTTAQKECEADVMDIMLETSLGLPVSDTRAEHLYSYFQDYQDEQAAKERPYEVTLEKLIDRVQTKVFRPYVEDINYYLDRHLPSEGSRNEVEAREVVKNLALLASAYDRDYLDRIDSQNSLFDADMIDSYKELYNQTKEEYRLQNSFVPKLAVLKPMGKEGLYDLCDVQLPDEVTADLIRKNPEALTAKYFPYNVEVGNVLALKENVLEDSHIYVVNPYSLQEITDVLQQQFSVNYIENKINCSFDAMAEYHCIDRLLKNNIPLEEALIERYNSLCDTFDLQRFKPDVSSTQLMARINLATEGLSQNNRELIAEYVFRTGNFEKAEKYADKLEKEPGITKQILQELRLVDAYKYMLWTIAEYENNNDVSENMRLTTGAYNSSAIPVLSDNVHSLSQINQNFLLIQKHASAGSIKHYAIVGREDGFRIAYVELKDYQPETVYSTAVFTYYDEAKDFYERYLETPNSRLDVGAKTEELVSLENMSNRIALSDITSIGSTIASRKRQIRETNLDEEAALEVLREELQSNPGIQRLETPEQDSEITILKEFKKMINAYEEEHFIELCNLDNFTDVSAMEESLQLAQKLSVQKNIIESISLEGMDAVRECVNAALDSHVTAADIERAYNAIDAAVLSSEFSGIEAEFENFEEYDNVLDTLKAAYVAPDKYCYVDYGAEPGPVLYTSDPAGNTYKKSLRNEWSGSVMELHDHLKEDGYQICTSMDDFRGLSANNRLNNIRLLETGRQDAYVHILESTNDMLPQSKLFSIYEFKSNMDKLCSGTTAPAEEVTYKLVTRENQEIHSYIDTYRGDSDKNVYEQLYGKIQETNPELARVISRQYYQDQLNFNERHLVRPLLAELKREQKPIADSDKMDALLDANDRLKEEIRKLDLSPADAELLKLNAGNIQADQIANMQQQIQMEQQMHQKQQQMQSQDITI